MLFRSGKESAIKSSIALELVKGKNSNKEKIDAIKPLYSKNYKIAEDKKKIDTKLVEQTTKSVFSSDTIRGVPYVYETTK